MTPVLAALLTAGVAALAPGPDLRIAAIATQERAASPGLLRVPTTLRNAGTRRAGASRTRYVLSRDRRPAGGVALASAPETGLGAARSRTRTARLTVPAAVEPGPWYVIACADARDEVRERRERDNCRASALPVDVVPQEGPPLPPLPAGEAG